MANPLDIAERHAVIQTCGITVEAERALLIARQGFKNLADLGRLKDDKDITEMVKSMAARNAADGRVYFGIVIIKNLQTLAWWVRDHMKRNVALHAVDFDTDTLDETAIMKDLYKERAAKEPSITALAKFDPDDFDTHEDAFLNLLSQTFGVLREPLRYVVCPATPPAVYSSEEEQRMYQFPLAGPGFQMDNMAVYRKLKAFLVDSPGWVWIEPHDMAENGRAAFLAWTAHYDGEGELSKRTALAKAKLKTVHYKSEQSMSFERCTEILSKCFQTLHKDPDERYSDKRKVDKLLEAIQVTDPELTAAKVLTESLHGNNFNTACAYFSQQVSRIHVSAQLEYRKGKSRKRGISSVNSQTGRGGWGRGRYGGRSGGRGCGGRGRGGRSGGSRGRRNNINGVDISDPQRTFSGDEWNRLGPEGRSTVIDMRERNPDTSRRTGGGRDGGGRGRGTETDRTIGSTAIIKYDADAQPADNEPVTDRGGRNGRGFGRGAYGRRGRGQH
jgi:hypothetical protein